MDISVSVQAQALAGSLLLGMAVGLAYDLIRIPRAYLAVPFLEGILDLLFWLVVTAALFLYAICQGDGRVRIFMAVALFAGAVVYFLLLSPWVRRLSAWMAAAAAALWRFLSFPLRKALAGIKKIKEKLRKVFPSWRKRYKIKLIPENESVSEQPEKQRAGRRQRWRKPNGRGS